MYRNARFLPLALLGLSACATAQPAPTPATSTAPAESQPAEQAPNPPGEGVGVTTVTVPAETLRLGLLPYLDWAKVAEDFAPLESYVAQQAGVKLELVLTPDYASLLGMLREGEVDLAALSAKLFLDAERELGEQLLLVGHTLAREAGSYHGLLVTQEGSGITVIEDAKGKRVAWVDRDSSSGYLFPRLALKAKGLDPENHFGAEHFAGSHDKALAMLFAGEVDVAAVWDSLWKADAEKPAKLVELLRSEPIPSDALVARAALDAGVRDRVLRVLLAVRELPEEQAGNLMGRLRIRGWEPPNPARYDGLRKALAP